MRSRYCSSLPPSLGRTTGCEETCTSFSRNALAARGRKRGPAHWCNLCWVASTRRAFEVTVPLPTLAEVVVRSCLADFYAAVTARAGGPGELSVETMGRVASLTWADFDVGRDLFVSRLWWPEYYLARRESGKG